MAITELIMPKMGESVAEATITKWLKNEGDRVEADEMVLEIATDKVDSEVPSPVAGVLVKKLFQEGEVVQVGKAIAQLSTDASESSFVSPVEAKTEVAENPSQATVSVASAAPIAAESVRIPTTSASGKFYSPLVRTIAREENISLQELESLKGSGRDGRVNKNDILNYVANRSRQTVAAPLPENKPAIIIEPPKQTPTAAVASEPVVPAVSVGGNDEIIEMDRMRKLIAEHMVMSKRVSPHVTSFVEADVTNLVLWRDRVKAEFEKREREKLTFTPMFVEAVARAIKEFPMVNVSVDGQRIIKRANINIGMATALPSGNLIVPIIRNADQKNLVGLTKAVNDLASRARANKLSPDDIQGGTFTISNVGTFGNVMGTPIINQPQVAILATGAIKKKPAVIETPQGDVIAIRHFMFLSLSYDHRVVDGSLGGSFLRRIADHLEQFDLNRSL